MFYIQKGETTVKNLVEIYCLIDNLVKLFDSKTDKKRVGRTSKLSKTDFIVLAIIKQTLGFKTTKQLYNFATEYLQKDFHHFPSYQQFNEGITGTFKYFVLITWILTKKIPTKKTKYHIVDSTPLPVCNNQYRYLAKVFKGLASPGKNLNGWFWGFKLHLIVNDSLKI